MPIIISRKCDFCHKFYKGTGKYFCSLKCRGSNGMSETTKQKLSFLLKGKPTWIKGQKLSAKTRTKMSKAKTGILSPVWKGAKACYSSIHQWVIRHKGHPKKCKNCGKTRRQTMLHWSNIDHKYRRILSDYQSLCVKCHKCFDMVNGLTKQ